VILQLGGWAWDYKLLTVKNKPVMKVNKQPWPLTDFFGKRPKRKKMVKKDEIGGHGARMG
jgi:hypothetical protein